jgi:integrase
MGEIRGLCVENVKFDSIDVRHSWEEGYGLKPPKFDSVREVPISDRVREAMNRIIEQSMPTSIVFYCEGRMDTPLSKSTIEEKLYRALQRIGISEVERRQRGIAFHSHRHFLNTMLLSKGVPEAKVREITGHRTPRMSQHYTHFRASDFHEVLALQKVLLEPYTASS